jgi:hypothetical protein
MQPSDVLALGMGGLDLGDDRVEIERGGIDDARAGRAPAEHRLGDQRARIEADRAGADQLAPAQGDEIDCAGAGADEVDGHGGGP